MFGVGALNAVGCMTGACIEEAVSSIMSMDGVMYSFGFDGWMVGIFHIISS